MPHPPIISLMLRPLLALLLALQPVHASDLPDLGEVSRQYFSDQDEATLGRAILHDVYSDPRYLDDPETEAYLNQLGYKLVSVSTRNHRDFTFFVVDDPSINAFALPGGNIGVHTGLLLAAQSESEFASVVAHEIAHVTQDHIARMVTAQSQSYWPTMAALALALLASRSNPDVAGAAIATTQAYSVQNQLNFSRDFEREADRLGYDMLTQAGFDPRGMSGFFNRLQRASRFYDSSAPAYLRTHPLTTERISDMEARSESTPYHQVPDSLDFQLIRARLRSRQDNATDTLLAARAALKDGRYSSETAARYGLALALLRARQFDEAESVAQKLVAAGKGNALLASLPGQVALAAGKTGLAVQRYQSAVQTHPGYRPLQYGLIAAQLAASQATDSLVQINKALDLTPGDRRLWRYAAQAHAQLGHKLLSHRAQAEAAALAGNLVAAIQQIELGIRAADGSFYDLSSAEARRREWQAQEKAQRKS